MLVPGIELRPLGLVAKNLYTHCAISLALTLLCKGYDLGTGKVEKLLKVQGAHAVSLFAILSEPLRCSAARSVQFWLWGVLRGLAD